MAVCLAVSASLGLYNDRPWRQTLIVAVWMAGLGFAKEVLLRGSVLRALPQRA